MSARAAARDTLRMNDTGAVLRLFPPAGGKLPLHGLYLDQALRERAARDRPYVYSNFIVSLDGRVSLPDPDSGRARVPQAIANARDWRLYMELLAQADTLITTASHLRAVAAGRHAQLLCVAQEYRDLVAWRREHGLAPQPDCIAVSRGLDLPARALCACHAGKILIATGGAASPAQAHSLRACGIEVLSSGDAHDVDMQALMRILLSRGYRNVYSIAGPRVLHALLAADVLDRLYLTLAPLALGGERFDALVRGPRLDPPRGFTLHRLFFDPDALARTGQLFASFDRARDK